MSISTDDVLPIASLAKMKISSRDFPSISTQSYQIRDYVNIPDEIGTGQKQPYVSPLSPVNDMHNNETAPVVACQ